MSFKGRAGGTRIGIAEKGQRGEERIEATERENRGGDHCVDHRRRRAGSRAVMQQRPYNCTVSQ